MRVKAVNREPVIRPEGTLALQGGEEVRKRGTAIAAGAGGSFS
jgi:hypothetical protein